MAELSLKDKKELAQSLYDAGHIQKEIAQRVKVSEKTICKWAEAGGWEELRTHRTITRKNELKRYYQQIKELNDYIDSREKGKRFPTPSEADTLNKLSAAIRNLEIKTPLGEVLGTCEELVLFIKSHNLKDAQMLMDYVDSFVKSKIRNEAR